MAIEEKALRMPKQIKPGDTLGVVAPSMPVKPEEKEKLTAYLQDAGYRVKLGKTVKELSSFHGYMGGDPRVRAEDVNQMFADPEVDGIMGPYLFGYNKKTHIMHFIIYIPICAVIGWICTFF